ncbi:unnamed protein product, partial [Heterosigma akashiwo]
VRAGDRPEGGPRARALQPGLHPPPGVPARWRCTTWRRPLDRPADADTFIMIGNILRETRRFPEAVERYRAAAAIDGGCVMALYNLANTLHDLRRFDEAIKYFLQALDLEPNLTHAHFNLGISYQAKQDIENAFQAYSRAAKLDPGFEDARAAAQRMKRKLDGRQHS